MVEIFTKDNDASFAMRMWLDLHGIQYQEYDIRLDGTAFAKAIKQTGKHTVPQINANGRWLIGFDQSKLEDIFNRRSNG